MTIEGASALNRVRWAQAGKEVAVGDSEGRIWIYDVGEVPVLSFLNTWLLESTMLIKLNVGLYHVFMCMGKIFFFGIHIDLL